MEQMQDEFMEMKTEIGNSREEILSILDKGLQSLERAREQIVRDKSESAEEELKRKVAATISDLAKSLSAEQVTKKIVAGNVGYFKHIAAFGKAVGKYMNPHIEDASYSVSFPKEILNKVILDHMYKNDLLESVEKFCAEAQIAAPTENKKKYDELSEIRRELKAKKLDKAMEWVHKNSSALAKNNSNAPFILYKLQVLLQ
eukprot:TRINITY_DN2850_c0_g1_i2.p1 TRINITY_DN2850_c0_g1~~TRINITY_DN2850_c0_g1_i2.p1  ORF type:complete len:234 (-),score=65.98 TRINITY_DN2850_c0_g1_i2:633-1235(-)